MNAIFYTEKVSVNNLEALNKLLKAQIQSYQQEYPARKVKHLNHQSWVYEDDNDLYGQPLTIKNKCQKYYSEIDSAENQLLVLEQMGSCFTSFNTLTKPLNSCRTKNVNWIIIAFSLKKIPNKIRKAADLITKVNINT